MVFAIHRSHLVLRSKDECEMTDQNLSLHLLIFTSRCIEQLRIWHLSLEPTHFFKFSKNIEHVTDRCFLLPRNALSN